MPKILDNSGSRIGEIKPCATSAAPDGWLLLSGMTISDAGNGGTALASAYARDLFVFLWNNYSNTELPIQNNAGAPVARGANALADFTTNDRRIPLPDLRGRNWIGKDDMGGSAANRVTSGTSGITGTTLGATGGDQRTHAHTHTMGVGRSDSSTMVPGGGAVRLPHLLADGFNVAPAASTGTDGAGASQNMPPGFVGTYIIKY